MKKICAISLALALSILAVGCSDGTSGQGSESSGQVSSRYSSAELNSIKNRLEENSYELGIEFVSVGIEDKKTVVSVYMLDYSEEAIAKVEEFVGKDVSDDVCVFHEGSSADIKIPVNVEDGEIYENAEINSWGSSSDDFLTNYLSSIYRRTANTTYRGLIKSRDELMSFIDKMDEIIFSSEFEVGSPKSTQYNFILPDEYYENYKEEREDFLHKYDEEYFEKYALLITQFIGDYQGGSSYGVNSISVDENNILSVVIQEASGFAYNEYGYLVMTSDVLKSEAEGVSEVSLKVTKNYTT